MTSAIVGQSVLTLLETRALAEIASYREDWRTARASVDAIASKVGRRYHPQSWRRAKRKLVKLGFIESERVLTGEPLPEAAKKATGSQYGTTIKRVEWHALGLAPRKVRAVRRAQRVAQAELVRRAEQAERARAKAAPGEYVPSPPRASSHPMPDDLAALLARGAAIVGQRFAPDG